MAARLLKEGRIHEGCWILLQYDVYGREQDMEQLWAGDVSWDGRLCVMAFGEADRGQSAKNGQASALLSASIVHQASAGPMEEDSQKTRFLHHA